MSASPSGSVVQAAPPSHRVTKSQVADVVARACPADAYRGRRILVIVPDGTRTAPVGILFQSLHAQVGAVAEKFDVLIALGTHQPMSEEAICQRLEITSDERRTRYGRVRFFNHAWDNPDALCEVGAIPADEIRQLTGGLFAMDVPVEVNKLLLDYDQVIIVGPVFPHEVVGYSGGNKYLFPGVGGPRILNFFHWLGAVVTNPMIIGNKWTPVRRVVDRAGSLVPVPKLCFCLVVRGAEEPKGAPASTGHLDGPNAALDRITAEHLEEQLSAMSGEVPGLAGLFAGSPEAAWDAASELSRQLHVICKDRPYHTILSCAPPMYDELWTGGKCMYKLEPVLADGGELIIYAPHISEVCVTHGRTILEVGYHCRDYFLKQWDKFKHHPWGVLAHSTHVRGIGTFENGVERCRAQVTLATAIPEEVCRRINLGYRDPRSIRPADFAQREAEGVLLVPKAGEMLFRLKNPPAWAAAS